MSQTTTETRSGWVVFASVMMFGLGGIAILTGIASLINGEWMANMTMLGKLVTPLWYGIFDIAVGLAALYGGYAIWKGQVAGYFLGMIAGTLNALKWFLFIPGAPFAAIAMLIIWVLVVYALAHSQEHFLS